MKKTALLAILATAGLASTALAQDSTSRNSDGGNGLPGDALGQVDFVTGNAINQRARFVLDLTPFRSSTGARFAIGPIAKSVRSNLSFFNNLTDATSISAFPLLNVQPPAAQFGLWNAATFGVNPTENNAPTQFLAANNARTQFAVSLSDFGTDPTGRVGNTIISSVANLDPATPNRLYVTRTTVATSADPITGSNGSLGLGNIDASGITTFRAEAFGASGGSNPIAGNNILVVNPALRDPSVQNNITGNFGAGGFGSDAPSSVTTLVNSAATHNGPQYIPSLITGGAPLSTATNFSGEFVRGNATVQASLLGTTAHRPGATDHRGNHTYSVRTLIPGANAFPGTFGLLTRLAGDQAGGRDLLGGVSLWRLDAAGNVVNAITLAPNVAGAPFAINVPGAGRPFNGSFTHYFGNTAFRGQAQVALGQGPSGESLVAATAMDTDWINLAGEPTTRRENRVPANVIVVGRFQPGNPAGAQWTGAAYVLETAANSRTFIGSDLRGDFGADGRPNTGDAGEGDGVIDATPIGNLINFGKLVNTAWRGPSISAPAFDSKGNLYFVATADLKKGTNQNPVTDTDVVLVRGVYDAANFSWRLELMLEVGQVFRGANSNLNYRIDFLNLATGAGTPAGAGASIDTDSFFANSANQAAFNGVDPNTLAQDDPRATSGLVLIADVTYDVDNDGQFQDPTGANPQNPNSVDESYQVVLYIQPDAVAQPPQCRPDLNNDGELTFDDIQLFVQLYNANDPRADFNNDQEWTFDDIQLFIQLFNAGC